MKIKRTNFKLFPKRERLSDDYQVYRTRESTAIEIASGLVVLMTWVFALMGIFLHGKNIDTTGVLVIAVQATVIIPLFLFLSYKPSCYNMPKKPTMKQFDLTVRFLRVVALLVAFIFLATVLMAAGWIHSELPIIILSCMIVVMIIIYTILYYAARK